MLSCENFKNDLCFHFDQKLPAYIIVWSHFDILYTVVRWILYFLGGLNASTSCLFLSFHVKWVKPQMSSPLPFYFYFFFLLFKIYFNWRLLTLKCCGGFCHTFTEISHWVYMCSPSWHSLPPPSPPHPSGSSQCTSPEHPVSCIEPGLAIYFTYDNIHISMLFSQIIPPSPSPTESKSLFFISVPLLLSHILGHCYHISKFHIYALIYCIVFFFLTYFTLHNRLQFFSLH